MKFWVQKLKPELNVEELSELRHWDTRYFRQFKKKAWKSSARVFIFRKPLLTATTSRSCCGYGLRFSVSLTMEKGFYGSRFSIFLWDINMIALIAYLCPRHSSSYTLCRERGQTRERSRILIICRSSSYCSTFSICLWCTHNPFGRT